MNTDPIADMLTRIRNAIMVRKNIVELPSSKIKRDVLKILVKEGYIKKFIIVDDNKQGIIKLMLKYNGEESCIQGLKKISKGGLRKYSKKQNIPKALNGLGVTILSTSKGVMTDAEAREANAGGEVLCQVW